MTEALENAIIGLLYALTELVRTVARKVDEE